MVLVLLTKVLLESERKLNKLGRGNPLPNNLRGFMIRVEVASIYDPTFLVRKAVPDAQGQKVPESIIEEEVDLDFLTSVISNEGESDETDRPKSNRRKHK